MGTKLFNKLPSHIKHLYDYNKFKKEIKNILLVSSFYTIAEFFHSKLMFNLTVLPIKYYVVNRCLHN